MPTPRDVAVIVEDRQYGIAVANLIRHLELKVLFVGRQGYVRNHVLHILPQ